MRAKPLGAAAALAVVTAALAACASGGPERPGVFDRLVGDRVHGDAEGVTVTGMGSVPEALPLAMGHCGRYQKSAQYARREGAAFVFRCVAS